MLLKVSSLPHIFCFDDPELVLNMLYCAEFAYQVIKDELETAMQQCGITSLDQAHPGLLNTGELDPLVPHGDSHPYARRIVRKWKL